ncbi:MAG: hypothetical protein AB8B53_10450 [Flavobacteriales bacterium]
MKHLLVILTAIISFSAHSQGAEETLPFVAYWSLGDSFVYEVEKTSVKMNDGVITENDTTRYTATFSVVDSTSATYTVSYAIKNDFPSQFGSGEIPEALKKFEEITLLILTDEFGSFKEIKNWEEVSEKLNNMTNLVVASFVEAGLIKESETEAVLKGILATMVSQQAIEQLAFQEIQLMLFPFGAELSTEELVYEELLPNVFGGDPIRADSRLNISDINREDDSCIISHSLSVNEKDTKKLIGDLMETMNLDAADFKKEINRSKYDMQDVTVSSFNYDYGLPLSVHYTRDFEIVLLGENSTQLKEIIIELVEVL